MNALVVSRGQFTKLLKEDADMGVKIYHNLLQIFVTRLRENNQHISKSRQEARQSRSEVAKQIAASTVSPPDPASRPDSDAGSETGGTTPWTH